MALRGFAAALAVVMFGGIAMLAAAPDASAQAGAGNAYHVPPNVGASECPAGQSVIYQVNADGRDEEPITIRYCTFPVDVAQGYVEVTTEAECVEGSGGWVPEAGLCWAGGDFGTDLTAAICQNSVFVENMVHPGLGTTNSCLIPLYKAAPVTQVPTQDGVNSVGVSGTTATVELSPDFVAEIPAGGTVTVSVNPIVYIGPIPANGIIQFTIPTGFEGAEYTVRATTTSGMQAILTFTLAQAPTPATVVVAPPAPADLEMKVTDPYTCGGGFTGEIVEGLAPFTISYRIEGQNYAADLGSFVSPTGVFETPEGYLDYSQIPDGVYSVSIRMSDSSQQTKSLAFDGFATEHITDDCGDDAASTAAAVAIPAAQPADNEQPVGLAVTGTSTDDAFLLSQVLLGFGLSGIASARLMRIRRRATTDES